MRSRRDSRTKTSTPSRYCKHRLEHREPQLKTRRGVHALSKLCLNEAKNTSGLQQARSPREHVRTLEDVHLRVRSRCQRMLNTTRSDIPPSIQPVTEAVAFSEISRRHEQDARGKLHFTSCNGAILMLLSLRRKFLPVRTKTVVHSLGIFSSRETHTMGKPSCGTRSSLHNLLASS